MPSLAPSLRVLFGELDAAWPARSHRLDGWFRPRQFCRYPSDHCPGADGKVRAIDFSNIGIQPDFVVQQVIRQPRVTAYVIWNRHIWGHWDGFRRRFYTGTSNPHTDHVHVSIQHTNTAWSFLGPWNIMDIPLPPAPKLPLGKAVRELRFMTGTDAAIRKLDRASRDLRNSARAID